MPNHKRKAAYERCVWIDGEGVEQWLAPSRQSSRQSYDEDFQRDVRERANGIASMARALWREMSHFERL